jgi:hypothetical protein
MSNNRLDNLFRHSNPPDGTWQLAGFRLGQTYRYRLANGSTLKFRVVRIYLGSMFRPRPELLIQYADTGTRQYVDPMTIPLA